MLLGLAHPHEVEQAHRAPSLTVGTECSDMVMVLVQSSRGVEGGAHSLILERSVRFDPESR